MLRKVFVISINLLLGLGVLVLTISYLTLQQNLNPQAQSNYPRLWQNQTVTKISPNSDLLGLGTLEFGELNFWYLQSPQTQITLTDVQFETHTQNFLTAKGQLAAGEISATNLLLGSQFIFETENLKIVQPGGTLSLSKTDAETHIKVFTGAATVTVYQDNKSISLVLPAERELILDPAKITKIFNLESQVEQYLTAQKMTRKFRSSVQGAEGQILNQILEIFPKEGAKVHNWKNFFQEKLIFLPAARVRFYQAQLLNYFQAVIQEPGLTPGLEFTNLSEANQKYLQEAAAALVQLTRLLAGEQILPYNQQVILSLARQESFLANLAGIAPLAPELNLLRQLALGLKVQTEPQAAEAFNFEILFNYLRQNSDLEEGDLELFAQINGKRTDRLVALVDQLRLTELLINQKQANLAKKALQDLARLFQQAKPKLSELERDILATKSKFLKNLLVSSAAGSTLGVANLQAAEALLDKLENTTAPAEESKIKDLVLPEEEVSSQTSLEQLDPSLNAETPATEETLTENIESGSTEPALESETEPVKSNVKRPRRRPQ